MDRLEKAIKNVNEGVSTPSDHLTLEQHFSGDIYEPSEIIYIRNKWRKLVGRTIVYVVQLDKERNFKKTIHLWTFNFAGGAVEFERALHEKFPPTKPTAETEYTKVGYTSKENVVERFRENRYVFDKKPGKGELYLPTDYNNMSDVIEYGNNIYSEYGNIIEINPN